MSVPEANALSPAPVKIRTLMARSRFACWQISATRSYIWKVNALRACGRLKVTRPMPSRTSKRMSLCSVMGNLLQTTVFEDVPRRVKLERKRCQACEVAHDSCRRKLGIFIRQIGAIDPHAPEAERGCAHHVPAVRRDECNVRGGDAEHVGGHRVDFTPRLVDADRVDREHGVEVGADFRR